LFNGAAGKWCQLSSNDGLCINNKSPRYAGWRAFPERKQSLLKQGNLIDSPKKEFALSKAKFVFTYRLQFCAQSKYNMPMRNEFHQEKLDRKQQNVEREARENWKILSYRSRRIKASSVYHDSSNCSAQFSSISVSFESFVFKASLKFR
jgi:hypothetical protein